LAVNVSLFGWRRVIFWQWPVRTSAMASSKGKVLTPYEEIGFERMIVGPTAEMSDSGLNV